MNSHCFRFRLRSRHGGPERGTESLSVAFRSDDSSPWLPLEPSLETPGFRLYLLSLLLCQHHYLVANALERHLPLATVEGDLTVTTSSGWMIETVSGTFRVGLDGAADGAAEGAAQGAAVVLDPDTISFLERRMKVCPVSRNLPETVRKAIVVENAD